MKFETPKIAELTPTNLNEYAILIGFHKKSWTPSARDAQIEENTKDREGYQGEARLYKQLVSKVWLEDFRKNARAAAKFHEENTLPWADRGFRILVASNYETYVNGMAEFVTNSGRLVTELQAKWPDAIAEARSLWPGDTFNEDDYPTVEEIPELFKIDWTERPIPNSDDFRLKDINPAMQKRMQEKLDADLSDSITEALAAPWETAFSAIQRIAETLTEGGRFEYTMVSNLSRLVAALPGLNISGDERLAEIAEDAKALLRTIAGTESVTDDEAKTVAKELRKDDGLKDAAAEDARKALDKMSGFMGGAA